jgi:hypothetical protein
LCLFVLTDRHKSLFVTVFLTITKENMYKVLVIIPRLIYENLIRFYLFSQVIILVFYVSDDRCESEYRNGFFILFLNFINKTVTS